MSSDTAKQSLANLEQQSLAQPRGQGRRTRARLQTTPVLDEPDSWLAPDLLEMLMATVRIGLDGEKVVDLAAVCPELYEQGGLWWPLEQLGKGIEPQRRADD